MSTYTRPSKPVSGGGSTSFVAGNTLPASELDSEFDGLTNKINGDLDEDNLSGSTQIPNSYLVAIDGTKVVDHADDEATYFTTTTPGDTGTPSLPTNLEEELERLRYRIGALAGYGTNVKYTDAANSLEDASWLEPPIVGPNLLVNANFETFTGSSGDAPDGWTETGTILASAQVAAPPAAGRDANMFSWTCTGSNAGFTQDLPALKASTKYLFGVRYAVTAGTVSISTAGGLAAGNDYQDSTITDSTTGATPLYTSIIVQTDSTPTDITASIVGTDGTANISVMDTWFYELGDLPWDRSGNIPMQTATVSTEDQTLPTTFDSSWDSNWEADTSLSLSQYVPGPGYRLIYEVDVNWATVSNGAGTEDTVFHYGFRARMNDGSDSTVDGPYIVSDDRHGSIDVRRSGVVHLRAVVENATPGTTYAFSYQVTAHNGSGTDTRPRLHPLINPTAGGTVSGDTIQTTSRAWLRVERI